MITVCFPHLPNACLLFHFYMQGLMDSTSLQSEQRTRYHLEAKTATDVHPMILSANVTRGVGRKRSFTAILKNVFKETASFSGETLLFLSPWKHQLLHMSLNKQLSFKWLWSGGGTPAAASTLWRRSSSYLDWWAAGCWD